MINRNLIFKNNNQIKSYKVGYKKLSKKFDKIYLGLKSDIKRKNRTLNVLDKNFKFNFKINELKKFKKFKTIALIGMGGSILGAEAIHHFLKTKVKKKFISLTTLTSTKY